MAPAQAQATVAVAAAKVAPAAMAENTSKNYLLLFYNPAELRGAGGFSGAVGVVSITDGSPHDLQIKNHDTFNPLIKKPLNVPYPLDRYLTFYNDKLELGDAGWDPDFPTSARASEALYNSATGTDLDGAVAFDPYAVQAMLGVIGPVDVPQYGRFNNRDFFSRLDQIVNASPAGKGALAPIAQVVVQKVLDAPVADWPRLLVAFQRMATQRHVQLYMHDDVLRTAAQQAHYDGSILDAPADYLLVADSNVGATKGDYFVKKSVDLKVQVSPEGVARHALTLTYDMPAPTDAVDRALNPGDGSYRDYLRIYLPTTANMASFSYTLDGQPGNGALDATAFDHDKRVFGIFLKVPRGHRGVVTFAYESAEDSSAPYQLYVQKQAGTPGTPWSVLVSRPGRIGHRSTVLDHDVNMTFG
jgi:hypothetical protein